MRKRISSSVELLQLLVIMQWLPTSTIRETENPLHCGRNVSFLPNNQLTLQCWSHQDFRPNVTGNIFILVKKSSGACFFPSKTTIRFQGQISLSLSIIALLPPCFFFFVGNRDERRLSDGKNGKKKLVTLKISLLLCPVRGLFRSVEVCRTGGLKN